MDNHNISRTSARSGTGFLPPTITRIEDTGLPALWLQDLALKILYSQKTTRHKSP